jgi:hypothetical protein
MCRKIRCDRYCANFFELHGQLNRPLAYNYLLEVSADCMSEPCVSGLLSRSNLAEKHAVVKQCAKLCRLRWEDNK